MHKAYLLVICLLAASFTGCLGSDDLSDDNKCYIHSSFDSNENWPYDWEEYCSDD